MRTSTTTWLLLIVTLPGRRPALRMRIWRNLKALGAGALRDGVYVLPAGPAAREALAAQAKAVNAAGGSAQLFDVSAAEAGFTALFDRADEYRELLEQMAAAARALRKASGTRAEREVLRIRREFEAIVSRDFFPDATQDDARRALDDLQARTERTLNPGEPHAAHGRIRRLDRRDFRGRTWATRARPWVDRLASAWLIRRFIDPEATIRWLKRPSRLPARILGFDFDGASFSHVDDKVTFEVLLHSFGLEADPGLQRLAAVVHYLDVGGLPVADATTLETILRSMRDRITDDDALLAQVSTLLDDLYAGLAGKASGS